mmetsp:Transcript_150471/g.483637  ORF Transcript_150471/g.483637 Transcript_150471/m.483637 type:complete len:205 (-) Transcript_150471:795-1409(-)
MALWDIVIVVKFRQPAKPKGLARRGAGPRNDLQQSPQELQLCCICRLTAATAPIDKIKEVAASAAAATIATTVACPRDLLPRLLGLGRQSSQRFCGRGAQCMCELGDEGFDVARRGQGTALDELPAQNTHRPHVACCSAPNVAGQDFWCCVPQGRLLRTRVDARRLVFVRRSCTVGARETCKQKVIVAVDQHTPWPEIPMCDIY